MAAAERGSASGAETWDAFALPRALPLQILWRGRVSGALPGRPKGVRRQPSTPKLRGKSRFEYLIINQISAIDSTAG